MPDPATLSPVHAALIEAARLRDDRYLVPPERVRGGARRRLADKLVALGVVQAVPGDTAAWWVDPDRGPIGLRLAADTDGVPGRTAAGKGGADDSLIDDHAEGEAPVSHAAEPRSWTKIARVIALLRQAEGADMAALVAATGWLPHTARAALTGLRGKGHAIVSLKRETDGRTVYLIDAAPGPASVATEVAQAAPAARR